MATYIEREAVLAGIEKRIKNPVILRWLGGIIREQPDADVAPVVHGRWIHDINNLYGCSECLGRETMSPKKLKPYCPNCGAHMKDGE